jgi:methionyl aminopeptidase
VNEVVVHGIPGGRVLAAGDVVSVDCGAILGGWHGDSAFTAVVEGPGDPRPAAEAAEDAALVQVTEEAMWRGIAAIREGERLNAVGAAVEDHVGDRYGLVEDYGGHGIGTEMHQDPHVLNYGRPGRGPKLVPGLVLAIEPMVTVGDPATVELDDGWTVITKDGSRAAHFEHTVAITPEGPWVLTAEDGGVAGLAPFGVTPRT